MSDEIRKVKAQTMEELDAEIKADMAALKASTPAETPATTPPEASATATPTPEPTPAPAPEVKPDVGADVETLRQAMAEKESKIEELRKRIQDADGRRGGELQELKRQNEEMRRQLQELTADVQKGRQAQPPAEPASTEPEPLADYDPAVRDGIRRLAKREVEAVAKELAKARSEIEAARKVSDDAAFRVMEGQVEKAVPKYREYNVDPKFHQWLQENLYSDVLANAASTLNSEAAIKIFRKYDAEQKPATVTPETPKGPVKPSKEAQVGVKAASEVPPPATPPKPDNKARIAELERKWAKHQLTPKESKELDDLNMQEQLGAA